MSSVLRPKRSVSGPAIRALEDLGEAVADQGGGLGGGRGPDGLVEDLYLDVARVAGGRHGRGDGREVDVAVADVAAAEQGVGGQRQDPVADLVADDAVTRPGDVGEQRRGPPRVIG